MYPVGKPDVRNVTGSSYVLITSVSPTLASSSSTPFTIFDGVNVMSWTELEIQGLTTLISKVADSMELNYPSTPLPLFKPFGAF